MFRNIIGKNKKDNKSIVHLDTKTIPKHIAIIMDGNGRWAKERNLPRILGHKAGVETIRDVVKECSKLNIQHLTLYAFSTENWKRPTDEVNGLMKLLVDYLKKELDELYSNNVIVNTIGDISKLPLICQNELNKAYKKTQKNSGLQLNLALNYGGRDELIRAFRKMHKDIINGLLDESSINEHSIYKYLYTFNIPDPDIIIRTSGEQRISNFLLWQCAYSELWFSDIKWPDFTIMHLHMAIYDFQKRNRRFGAL